MPFRNETLQRILSTADAGNRVVIREGANGGIIEFYSGNPAATEPGKIYTVSDLNETMLMLTTEVIDGHSAFIQMNAGDAESVIQLGRIGNPLEIALAGATTIQDDLAVAGNLLVGSDQAVIMVAKDVKGTDTIGITNTPEVNILTATIPNPINGATYRATATCYPTSNTIGAFTEGKLKHAIGANIGGTEFCDGIKDHRIANRRETFVLINEFTFTGTTGQANYNVVLTLTGNGGTTIDKGSVSPSRLYVERIA